MMKRILIESGFAAGSRELMEGISFYVRERRASWQLYSLGPEEFLTAIKSRPDAALTVLTRSSQKQIDAARRSKIPIVNMLRNLHPHLPSVAADHHAIGAAAAEYFLSRGFQHFAFFGTNREWSDGRLAGFQSRLQKSLHSDLHIHNSLPNEEFRQVGNPRITAVLRKWLPALPHPIALLAAADYIARPILETCKTLRIPIPDHLSLLGVDNDPAICELGPVPLSSIPRNFMRIGFEAARMLDGIMTKRRRPRAPILIPPRDMIIRRSTDFIAAANPHVAAAVRFLHAPEREIPTMKTLLHHLQVSRQWLDQEFKSAIGQTPSQQIRQLKLARARSLLLQSHLSVHEIARRCGFSHPENLTRFLHDQTGLSARRLRNLHPFTH